MEALKALQETRSKLAAEIRKLADKANDTDAEWAAEDQQNWDKLNADYDANKAQLDAENEKAKRQADFASRLETLNADEKAFGARIGRDGGTIAAGPVNKQAFVGQEAAITDTDRALALQGWVRAHSDTLDVTDGHREAAKKVGLNLRAKVLDIHLAPNFSKVQDSFRAGTIRNDLSAVEGSQGAFTFGSTFVTNLEQAMLAFGGVLQVAQVIRTNNGEPMTWPTADDTSNTGEVIGETASIGSSVDPTFGVITWGAHKFSSKAIKVPYELLEDSAFDLPSTLAEMLGTRLGRIQNTRFTTGLGSGQQPQGIVTGASAGVTTASGTAIAFDEVIDLEHSVDPSRRNLSGVGYMFHDSILKALRKLKDGEGRYLWQAGANTGAPDTLNTYMYTINQDMASSIATTNVTMLFGQLSQYKVRQVNQIRFYRLVERYRDNDEDGFIAFIRGDGAVLNAGDNPIKKMTQL